MTTRSRSQTSDMGIGRFGRRELPPLPDFGVRQQVEGYASTVSQPGMRPHHARPNDRHVSDYRGANGVAATREWWRSQPKDEPDLVWTTAPAPEAIDSTFSFAGTSASLPENHYPANRATLYADGKRVLVFEIGLPTPAAWAEGEWALEFTPRQARTAIDGYHRQFEAGGCSGIYRLAAPGSALRAGKSLELKVVLEPRNSDAPCWFAVIERPDVLAVTSETNADEIEQLQQEILRLKQIVGGLARHSYPELFPDHLQAEEVVIYTNGWKHVHPPDVELLANGDLLASFREASEHLSPDGRIVTVRSTDGGKTWGDRLVVHEEANTDVRDASIGCLSDGTLILTDFVNGYYDGAGRYVGRPADDYTGQPEGIYVARSTDHGKHWEWLGDGPLDPAPYSWIGTTERVLELPNGDLLMATYFVERGEPPVRRGCALYKSTDRGVTWSHVSVMADIPGVFLNEPALIRTVTGRLIGMLRRESGPTYYQVLSDDDGETWTEPVSSEIPARANPASLVSLPDGAVLCIYGSRHDVRGMYVVASYDNGESWDMEHRKVIRDDFPNWDIGYPSSVLLPDGRVLAVYYFNMFERYFIAGSIFRWERPATDQYVRP